MAAIRAVIFDLGRVLVGWDIAQGLWAEFRKVFGPPGDRTPAGLAWERLYDRYARGGVSPRDFHREFCSLSGFELGYDEFVSRWCDIFYPMDGMESLFVEVAERVPVGLLSDTDPLHWMHAKQRYPWLGRIEKPTLSFDTGALKPEPEAYLAAARNLNLPPQACLFTDDLPENVDGALTVGMDAVRFTDSDALRRQLVSRGLLDD